MNNNNFSTGIFKQLNSTSKRKKNSEYILNRYPDRIPIIVEYSHDFPNEFKHLEKQKFLVPNELIINDFLAIIRKYIKLEQTKALCFMCNHKLLCATDTLQQVYTKNKDQEDQFLYIIIMIESTFGTFS
jgi:hypothetical protein